MFRTTKFKLGLSIIILVECLLLVLLYNTYLNIKKERKYSSHSDWLLKMEKIQKMRKARIRRICTNHRPVEFNRWDGQSNLRILDPINKLAFCNNAKAASTTWFAYFLEMSSQTQEWISDHMGQQILYTVVPWMYNPINLNLTTFKKLNRYLERNDILTFSFVRHPFDRLVSAFEERILYNKYPRAGFMEEFHSLVNKSFSRFIELIIEQNDICTNPENFASASRNDCHVNVHWRRYSDRCNYCNIDYDVIGTVETFADDTKYIFVRQGLNHMVKKVDTFKRNSIKKSINRTQHYFSQLSSDMKKNLYQVYEKDFLLFGYDPDIFL